MKKWVSVEEVIARIDAALKENETQNETEDAHNASTLVAAPTHHAIPHFSLGDGELIGIRSLMQRQDIETLRDLLENYRNLVSDVSDPLP